MIELKTAVLIGASFEIGAIIGGGTDHDIQQIYQFGKKMISIWFIIKFMITSLIVP